MSGTDDDDFDFDDGRRPVVAEDFPFLERAVFDALQEERAAVIERQRARSIESACAHGDFYVVDDEDREGVRMFMCVDCSEAVDFEEMLLRAEREMLDAVEPAQQAAAGERFAKLTACVKADGYAE